MSTIKVWEVEEWNGVDFRLLHFPAIWLGFWKYFAKTNRSFTSPKDLSCRLMCRYPHQAIASFHPTSKDGLSHGRGNGSMHLCHIYCKIKQWIHGDYKSHKLIKIVHMCGRWMVEMGYSFYGSLSLFFIWITWRHDYNIRLFFSWNFMCPIFFQQ